MDTGRDGGPLQHPRLAIPQTEEPRGRRSMAAQELDTSCSVLVAKSPSQSGIPWPLRDPACNAGDPGLTLGHPLEEGMAAHSSVLPWRIPWTEEPGGLPSVGHKELGMTERLTLYAF